jgi:uncharacterized OB-fold protein
MSGHHPLDLRRCAACGAWWALRPYACAGCGGTDLHSARASGEGEVIAHSTVHRAPDASWRALAPYELVLVRLREGAVLMGHAAPGVAIGQAVLAREFEHDGRSLLCFQARRPP